MNIVIICIIIILGIIIFLNYLYKNTNYYKNQMEFYKGYIEGVPENLQVVNLGSTYAKYAFNYDDIDLRGFNFALPSQSLEMDFKILKKYSNHLQDNCIVYIPIAPPLLLCDEKYQDNDYKYYYFFNKKDITNYSFLTYCTKVIFPVITAKKQVLRVVFDLPRKKMYDVCDANYILTLVDVWKKTFKLPDLKTPEVSSKNRCAIEHNIFVLTSIIEYCIANKFTPVLVTTPFSKKLNSYFSKAFINAYVTQNILKANKFHIPFADYRANEYYQNKYDLFIDEGFRLNENGSKQFTKMLISDFKKVDK